MSSEPIRRIPSEPTRRVPDELTRRVPDSLDRRLPDPGFAGDDGAPDARLRAALEAYGEDRALLPGVLAALHCCRVLAPVVALHGESDVTPDRRTHDTSADIAVPLLVGADGRRALPVFTGLSALARWDPQARPVPVLGPSAARVARSEAADVLVLDVAGPHTAVLEAEEVRALAEGRGAVPAYDDEVLAAAVAAVLRAEPAARAAWLGPCVGVDARLTVALLTVSLSGRPGVAEVAARLAERLGALDAWGAAAVRGLDLAVVADDPAHDPGDDPADDPAATGRLLFTRPLP